VKFSTNQLEIEPGDILIGYTDGVTEALAPNGELFSREQLLSLLEQPSVSASDIIEKIKTRLSNFINEAQQSDDITMIAVQRLIKTA